MTMVLSFPSLLNVGSLLALVIFIYAVLGVNMFTFVAHGDPSGGDAHGGIAAQRNFDNAFNICCSSSASRATAGRAVMADAMKDEASGKCSMAEGNCGSPAAIPYFISFQVIGSFIFLNLVVAVILENFAIPLAKLPDLLHVVPKLLGVKGKPKNKAMQLCFALRVPQHSGNVAFQEVVKALIEHNFLSSGAIDEDTAKEVAPGVMVPALQLKKPPPKGGADEDDAFAGTTAAQQETIAEVFAMMKMFQDDVRDAFTRSLARARDRIKRGVKGGFHGLTKEQAERRDAIIKADREEAAAEEASAIVAKGAAPAKPAPPAAAAATKPAATKPAATKPAATKPAATKPAATKPAATAAPAAAAAAKPKLPLDGVIKRATPPAADATPTKSALKSAQLTPTSPNQPESAKPTTTVSTDAPPPAGAGAAPKPVRSQPLKPPPQQQPMQQPMQQPVQQRTRNASGGGSAAAAVSTGSARIYDSMKEGMKTTYRALAPSAKSPIERTLPPSERKGVASSVRSSPPSFQTSARTTERGHAPRPYSPQNGPSRVPSSNHSALNFGVYPPGGGRCRRSGCASLPQALRRTTARRSGARRGRRTDAKGRGYTHISGRTSGRAQADANRRATGRPSGTVVTSLLKGARRPQKRLLAAAAAPTAVAEGGEVAVSPAAEGEAAAGCRRGRRHARRPGSGRRTPERRRRQPSAQCRAVLRHTQIPAPGRPSLASTSVATRTAERARTGTTHSTTTIRRDQLVETCLVEEQRALPARRNRS